MIPEKAKKVFTGIIFNIYQREQKLFDGTTAIFEKAQRNNTIDVIAVDEEKNIYILEEEQPGRPKFYGLVGGTGEYLEDSLNTAKRELLEETGLESNSWELYGEYSFSGKIDYKSYIYIAKNCINISKQNLDSGEKIVIHKVSWDEFKNYVLDKKFRVKEFALDLAREIILGNEKELKDKILN